MWWIWFCPAASLSHWTSLASCCLHSLVTALPLRWPSSWVTQCSCSLWTTCCLSLEMTCLSWVSRISAFTLTKPYFLVVWHLDTVFQLKQWEYVIHCISVTQLCVIDVSFFSSCRCFLLPQPVSDGGQPAGDTAYYSHPLPLQPVQGGASLAQCTHVTIYFRCRLRPSTEETQAYHSFTSWSY